MKKWKHSWDVVFEYGILAHHELLTKRSNEGWEMVSAVYANSNLRIYWKKEIIEPCQP